ncbi:DUF2254 domain-containing protein [Paracoccus sp. MBLB3053]|uniref:DUF2254 domain-containing protein n=1 Tax=Paracoccus aurantius TaxID=3073814 RepID=A0ABU2HYJ3_9RHOB|nr:DUF2254 domain-containing protein [Paracoccus sp. MBLB3053]MDS9470122.1 DUF2254 domain-containing protein [Paracoccus sp. MBLB3053]
MSRWQWMLRQLTRRLWFRASLIGLLGVFTAIFAAFAEEFVPWKLPGKIGADAVESLLNIIASSMLAVTTFSLSVMTSAYGAATSNVTPRATKLLDEDRVTQNVLSTFIGTFLFSIVGIIVLKTGAYGERGRLILFAVTIGVVALIVITLLRWIDHLTRLGRVGETTNRVEQATRNAIEQRLAAPCLGGLPLRVGSAVPDHAISVMSEEIGYLQNIDMPALAECADKIGATINVPLNPGSFVYPDMALAWLDVDEGRPDDEVIDKIRAAFTIGIERSFDQDPRFGLAVLSEIACRALSPAVNDFGTAIDVIGRTTRLMALWGKEKSSDEVDYPKIRIPPLQDDDLFEDAFMLVGRDGAGLIEVQLRLQKVLLALSQMGGPEFRAAAARQAEMAMDRSAECLAFESDRHRLTVELEARKAIGPRRSG